MRKFTYARLRQAPRDVTGITAFVTGIWAGVDGVGFLAFWRAKWAVLDVSATGFLIAGILAGYTVLLYVTRHWDRTDRDHYHEELGKISDDLVGWDNHLFNAETDADFEARRAEWVAALQNIHTWMRTEMGRRALNKFESVTPSSYNYPWPGEHDGGLRDERNRLIDKFHDYKRNLDELMGSGTWDDPVPRGTRQWRQRRKEAWEWTRQKLGLTAS